MKQILPRHPKKHSRSVLKEDLQRVMADAKELHRICFEKHGVYFGAVAMAHVQIEANDPLRFFVKKDGTIICNPIIVQKDELYTHKEGCMSYSFRGVKKVIRYRRIKVSCFISHVDNESIDLLDRRYLDIEDLEAAIYQHEIGHFNLNTIY